MIFRPDDFPIRASSTLRPSELLALQLFDLTTSRLDDFQTWCDDAAY
jgi:hypothetical protein